ncbi:MAG: rhodanese-like domain-containing protein [Aggregatilineales bacterium]
MANNPKQVELIGLFNETRAAIQEFVESRTDIEKTERGSAKQWAAKDLLAEVGFWMEYMVERMGYFERGEPAPREVDFGALNLAAFETNQNRPWSDVAAYVERSLAVLIAAVKRFTDEQLNANNVYGDGPGDALWGEIRANGFIWPLQEFEKFYIRTGDQVHAKAMQNLLRPVVGEPETVKSDLIDPAALRTQLDSDRKPLVIDVRGAQEYAAGHVQSAVNIRLADLPKKLKKLPNNVSIVTYCNMHHPGQSRGERAAALLADNGFKAMAIDGGFPAWQDAGLPVEKA